MEWPLWWSHGATGAVCFLGACGLNFLSKRQESAVTSLLKVIATYGERIMKLETKCDKLHDDHTDCLETQAGLRREIEMMKDQDRGLNRHMPVTQ